MRHGKKVNKLSRPAEHRKALLNNLALALISYKQIRTTDTKAKALKQYMDRLISTALKDTLHARRLVAKSLPNKAAFKELFDVIVPKLEGRTSGFSRIVKYGTRKGDGASISIIELLMEKEVVEKDKKKSKKKATPKPKSDKKASTKAKPEVEEAEAVEEKAEATPVKEEPVKETKPDEASSKAESAADDSEEKK
jgi:large subunit ribosomal protein L17